jgi:hypothetical protein
MENIMFIDFFVELGKYATCIISMCLPFPICKTHRVSARLLSSSSSTVYKFSPTLPTRTHVDQLLNIRQLEGFEDLIQFILHRAPPELHVARVQKFMGVVQFWRLAICRVSC